MTDSDALISAITAIAHGDRHGPTGLEMLSMAVSGDHDEYPVAVGPAIRDGLGAVAEALREVAAAIRGEPSAG